MITQQITHMSPGNAHHMQSVLENKHYGKVVKIIEIRTVDNEKYVDYEIK